MPAPMDVALILATDPYGRLLLGQRNDTQAWSLPGGHAEPGESPMDTARRELVEETGLAPKSLTYLGHDLMASGGKLHRFSALVQGVPDGSRDPDNECDRWEFVDVRNGIPGNIWSNLHGPAGDENLVRRVFDLQKSDRYWLNTYAWVPCLYDDPDDCPDVECPQHTESIAKAESEVESMLRHPDPRERALALRLGSCTPRDVARAVLDPSEQVWRAALEHPLGALARSVAAANSRDSAGLPMWNRHDALLSSPHLRADHVGAMYRATRDAAWAPEPERAPRIAKLVGHPLLPAKDAPILHKALSAHSTLAQASLATYDGSGYTPPVAFDQEKPLSSLGYLTDAYSQFVDVASPPEPMDEDLGGGTAKVVYQVPDVGRVMVKPYFEYKEDEISSGGGESSIPLAGWAELTSQTLFHAAGLGSYHQSVVPVWHGAQDLRVPAYAIQLKDGQLAWSATKSQVPQSDRPVLRRIAILDYLQGNDDSHGYNLLLNPVQAIDHGMCFRYSLDKFDFHGDAATGLAGMPNAEDFAWWTTVSAAVSAAFNERLKLVTNPTLKDRVSRGFQDHFKALDTWSKLSAQGRLPEDWFSSKPPA